MNWACSSILSCKYLKMLENSFYKSLLVPAFRRQEPNLKWEKNAIAQNTGREAAFINVRSVQFSLVAQSCPTLCDPMDCSTPGFPVYHQLLEFTNSCPLSWWRHPTISSSVIPFCHLQSFPASGSFQMCQFFTSGGQSIGSFSFSISPSNEHPGLIFRMDWLDLLAAQGTLKSLLQHHSSKASILWRSAFFIVQLYIHTWQLEKT